MTVLAASARPQVSGRRRRCSPGLSILVGTGGALLSGLRGLVASNAFSAGATVRVPQRLVLMGAEAEPAPTPTPTPAAGESVALVKVTEESKMTTASLLGGLFGLVFGGVWVGGAIFAASSYLARRDDDDLSKALKGIAGGSLEALNFGAYINDKYAVTDKVGGAITDALGDDSKKAVDGLLESVKAADQDFGFKESYGALATSASELASQAVAKGVELNEEYKVTGQIVEKINEATKSASK
mmetsp:Transcript_142638/g.397469  ORF Transcript_142638/g.397469 Transcript_142638/m.397469 type:complete len:242 (+) Transcript_142638:95-820(+)|eukprot:CAMPEP_0179154298 /NCGR_PEP_ID=MMETSP0796-20121207/75084_1 /TAXON_ID=73915 /ORGANISM="Pyrodinium bahamense, Strain pbaha01" /LENGTH=241 /DNA_ID=CAMNT_0020855657 /DNA_START=51 /DNA_END=776 /DNA_ORIENTATION=-